MSIVRTLLGSLVIDNSPAGANIQVISEREEQVFLEQEIRDSADWWFYWKFAARSDIAQTVTFTFTNGDVIGPYGPAVSTDGIHWSWLNGSGVFTPNSFQYSFREGEAVHFCFSIPYQMHHFETFYSGIAQQAGVWREVLCLSEELRAVPLLRVGSMLPAKHFIFTCRHHACESTVNYVLEGLLEWVLAHPESYLRKNCLIHYVPFIDLDGVERGDQGKNRKPHDHNRDYMEQPIYRSTEALQRYTSQFTDFIGIDFHCPYRWGGRNNVPFVVKRHEPQKSRSERFSRLLVETAALSQGEGAIAYQSVHNIEADTEWNQRNSSSCASMFERAGAELCFTFEMPYFGVPTAYSADSLRRFGEAVAEALERYVGEGGDG